MRLKFRHLAILTLLLLSQLLTGCGYSKLSKKFVHTDLGSDSVIVLGVSPEYRLSFNKGRVDPDGWKSDTVDPALTLKPEENFIVAKIPGLEEGRGLAIGAVRERGFIRPTRFLCKGDVTPTFGTPAGKVVYVGSLEYSVVEGVLNYRINNELDKARTHLAKNHPTFEPHIEYRPLEIRKINNAGCEYDLPALEQFLRKLPVVF